MARLTRRLWLTQRRGEVAAASWILSRVQSLTAPAGRWTREGKQLVHDLPEDEGNKVFEEVAEAGMAVARLVDSLATRESMSAARAKELDDESE